MAMKLISLSEEDVKLLQRLLDMAKVSNSRIQSPSDGLWSEGEAQSAPAVYVAKPSGGSIPALTVAAGWTGTGTGTGTAPECDQWDSPGSAECRVYEIVDTNDCGPALMEVESHDEKVYNVTESIIQVGNGYIPIQRDIFGKWLASTSQGGTGALRKAVLTTDLDMGGSCTIQELTYDPLGRLCVRGSTFTAHDPFREQTGTANMTGCWFQIPTDDPLGRAEIVGPTCPLYEFDASCAEAGTGTGS